MKNKKFQLYAAAFPLNARRCFHSQKVADTNWKPQVSRNITTRWYAQRWALAQACGATVLLAIALAPQLFLNGWDDVCAARILAILSAIVQAQFKKIRNDFFQSNKIKVKKKTFMRYVGVARIFYRMGGPNHKSHPMTLSKFFEKRDFLWDKNWS